MTEEKQETRPFTYTVAQAKKATSLGTNLLYRILETGQVETRKVFGRRLIIAQSLHDYIEREADNRPPSAFRDNPRQSGVSKSQAASRVPLRQKPKPT